MSKEDTYSVWRRGDGYIGVTAYRPRSWGADPLNQFEELLSTQDWRASHARIVAEHVAAVMNEDIWPIQQSAEGNRAGVSR